MTKITKYLTVTPLREMKEHAKIIWLWLMDNQNVAITIRDLGELLNMTPLTISRSIIALEQNKLLARVSIKGIRGQSFSYQAIIPNTAWLEPKNKV